MRFYMVASLTGWFKAQMRIIKPIVRQDNRQKRVKKDNLLLLVRISCTFSRVFTALHWFQISVTVCATILLGI